MKVTQGLFNYISERQGNVYINTPNGEIGVGYKNEYLFMYRGKVIYKPITYKLNLKDYTLKPFTTFIKDPNEYLIKYFTRLYGIAPLILDHMYLINNIQNSRLNIITCNIILQDVNHRDNFIIISKGDPRYESGRNISWQVFKFDEIYVKKCSREQFHFTLNPR